MRPELLQRYKHRRCNEYDRDYVRLQAPLLTQDDYRNLAQNAASYIVDLATGLKPSGHGGFEDFVRKLYQGWTGRRAYLAGSGLQHGGDAGGVGENDIADCISCPSSNKVEHLIV